MRGLNGGIAKPQRPRRPIASRYDAFISYSHAADNKLAPVLQQGLHSFAKPLWQRRALRVFRDDTNLAANPGLWSAIEEALAASKFFVLLASPESAQSKWVHREVDFWCRNKAPDSLLIILTDGEIAWDGDGIEDFAWVRTTAIPKRLQGVFREEPRWIDLRWARSDTDVSLRNPRFRESVADLAAPLHDRPKDDLIGEDVRQHRRAIRLRNGAVTLLAVLFLVASLLAYIAKSQQRLAEAQRDKALRSQSLFLTGLSSEQLRAGDAGTAVRLALEALPTSIEAPNRPYVRQAEIALARALEGNREHLVLRGHTAAIMSLDFSPEGSRLATASKDGSARIWDVATGVSLAVLSRGDAAMREAFFSPDGRRVLTVAQNGKAWLWDANSGEFITSISDQPQKLIVNAGDGGEVRVVEPSDYAAVGDDWIHSASFSPKGDTMIANRGDGTICFWDAVTGEPRDCFEVHRSGMVGSITDAARNIEFSPDGKMFVTAGGEEVYLWDTATRRPIASFEGHRFARRAGFSADGKSLLVIDDAGWASLWGVSPPALRATLQGHKGAILDGAISPDSKSVITVSEDGTARLWVGPYYSDSGRLQATLSGHESAVFHAAFSADSKLVVTASDDGTARVWGTERGDPVEILRGHGGSVIFVQFSPRGDILATAGNDGTVRLWTFGDERSQITLDIGDAGVEGAWDRGGHALVTPYLGSAAQIWDATNGKAIVRLAGHEADVVSALFSADGSRVATLTKNGSVRLWDAETGALKHILAMEGGAAKKIALSADGRLVFATDSDKAVWIWSETGTSLFQFRSDSLRHAAMSPDGRHVVTVVGGTWSKERGNEALLWDVGSEKATAGFGGHREPITGVGFSPDSRVAFTAAGDGSVQLWDVDSHTPISRLNAYEGLWGNPDVGTRFSSDSRTIATFSGVPESRIRVWDVRDGALLAEMTENSDRVNDVSFSPSKRWLVSASQDGTARLWDLETGLLATVFRGHRISVSRVLFSPDGQRILTTSSDGTARIWDLPPTGQTLIDLARMRAPQPLTANQQKRFFLATD